MAAKDLVVLTARSGVTSVEVGGKPYHSPYDPQHEAQKFCGSLPIEDADVIFLFGWGLGYSGRALVPRMKTGARVIVFEPNESLFKLSRVQDLNRQLFEDPRFEFVVGQRISRFFDEWPFQGGRNNEQFLWIEWPPAVALHGHVLHSLKVSFKTRSRGNGEDRSTHFQKGCFYFENVLANFRYQDSSDVGRLFGRFQDVPLVIVSAGPSLDLNVHHLAEMDDRCFVLAVDSALKPLLAAGVTPHAVMVSDSGELNARHVAGAVPESVYLIAEQAVPPVVLASAPRRFLFGIGVFPDPLFAKFGFGKSTLEVWGSASTAALDLACRMGANPIIFAGHDFAFSWSREYASHTIFHGKPFSPELGGPIEELDIQGNAVRTTEDLIAYRDFFVRKIATQPHIRFINGTEGGILRESVGILPLQKALRQSCKRRIDVSSMLHERYQPQKPSREALQHFVEVLKSGSRNCSCLASFLELTAGREIHQNSPDAIDEKIQWGIERTQLALDCPSN